MYGRVGQFGPKVAYAYCVYLPQALPLNGPGHRHDWECITLWTYKGRLDAVVSLHYGEIPKKKWKYLYGRHLRLHLTQPDSFGKVQWNGNWAHANQSGLGQDEDHLPLIDVDQMPRAAKQALEDTISMVNTFRCETSLGLIIIEISNLPLILNIRNRTTAFHWVHRRNGVCFLAFPDESALMNVAVQEIAHYGSNFGIFVIASRDEVQALRSFQVAYEMDRFNADELERLPPQRKDALQQISHLHRGVRHLFSLLSPDNDNRKSLSSSNSRSSKHCECAQRSKALSPHHHHHHHHHHSHHAEETDTAVTERSRSEQPEKHHGAATGQHPDKGHHAEGGHHPEQGHHPDQGHHHDEAISQTGTESPIGFAAEATGGGSAKCETAADIKQLESWLEDSEQRCILLDKEYDYRGSMGNAVMKEEFPEIDVNIDKAGLATEAIDVGSHKTIRGVGSNAAILGRGLLIFHQTNVIIENIWFKEINAAFVFGGDAIALKNTDLIVIRHCKFSLIGRQMIVTGHEPVGRITISDNEFDGFNPHSATCNQDHYWNILFYGQTAQITMARNFLHEISGRGPQVAGVSSFGSNIYLHAIANLWKDVDGLAFNAGKGAQVLCENNRFENVRSPVTNDNSNPAYFVINNNQAVNSGSVTGSKYSPDLRKYGTMES
ncbi:hypothetical protein MRB53_041746 [Persea americana]|nr:hypothetical protein MRB53_041746 [Persea americana]